MLAYSAAILFVLWIARRVWRARRLPLGDLFAELFAELFRRGSWASRPRTRATGYALYFGLAFLVFAAVLEPWRIYKFTRTGTSAIVSAPLKYSYYRSWEPEALVPSYYKAGNAPCLVSPQLCKVVWENMDALSDENVRDLAIMTVVAHPLEFAWVKLRMFNWLWFGREWGYVFLEKPWMAAEGLLLLGLGGLGVARLLSSWRNGRSIEGAVALLMVGLFILINAAVFGALTYEWRYSQALRTLAFLLPFAATGIERLALRAQQEQTC
jgi:hypothetical protein